MQTMKTVPTTKFTLADYLTIPEGFPAELVQGQLVKTPSPKYGHQRLVVKLVTRWATLVGENRLVPSPIDVFIDDHNVLQPDLAILTAPLSPDAERIGIPVLVVEILSPSTARRDREVKAQIYLDAGVKEVWLLDRKTETVEIRTVDQGVATVTADEPVRSRAVPELTLLLRELLT